VAKNANIFALATGCSNQEAAVTRAVQWITANATPPAVVNLSFVYTPPSPVISAITLSIARGFVYTLSAGCGPGRWGPEIEDKALVVAGTDSADTAWGTYSGGNSLFAPAVGIRAAGSLTDTYEFTAPNACVDSYAAPHVAGVAATYLQFNPTLDPAVVKRAIIRPTTPAVTNPGSAPNRLLYSCPLGFGPQQVVSLESGQSLLPGQSVYSPNGQFQLLYQFDGNLVLYRVVDMFALWSSRTVGFSAGQAYMQNDGNFVVYDASIVPRWSSGTAGAFGAYLAVQSDSNLVIYSGCGPAIWDRFRP
jgi:hypothetical protein